MAWLERDKVQAVQSALTTHDIYKKATKVENWRLVFDESGSIYMGERCLADKAYLPRERWEDSPEEIASWCASWAESAFPTLYARWEAREAEYHRNQEVNRLAQEEHERKNAWSSAAHKIVERVRVIGHNANMWSEGLRLEFVGGIIRNNILELRSYEYPDLPDEALMQKWEQRVPMRERLREWHKTGSADVSDLLCKPEDVEKAVESWGEAACLLTHTAYTWSASIRYSWEYGIFYHGNESRAITSEELQKYWKWWSAPQGRDTSESKTSIESDGFWNKLD